MSLRRGIANTTGILLLALVIFYSTRYWPQRLPLLQEGAQPVAEDHRPDYVITDFHAIDLDEGGRIRYELTATRLAHFLHPERAELEAPDMVFYRNDHADTAAGEDPAPWQLTSATGVISDAGKRLDLAGDVRLARLLPDEQPGMSLETSQLTVFGSQETARTDQPFTLRTPQGHLTGTGLDVDLKRGRMNLHAQVRGQYDPP